LHYRLEWIDVLTRGSGVVGEGVARDFPEQAGEHV
jgi:hypothetical protein